MTSPDDAFTTPPLAVVTGASTGIGRALAKEFVDHGFDVVIAAEEPAIHQAAADLAMPGRRVVGVQVDLSTADGVETLYAKVAELGRTPEAVALNAGIGVSGRFDETGLEDDLRLVDLNVRSTVHLGKLLIRDLVAAGRGRVLVTSSIAAVAPGPYHSTYAASKAFVHSFAEGIREELKDTGVTVTSLMPGPTDTEFFRRADMGDTPLGQSDKKDDADEVAHDGYEALMSGKSSVVAGSAKNRIQAELGTHLPDALAAPLMARMTRPRD
jgi:short-subunit dehydrogenase